MGLKPKKTNRRPKNIWKDAEFIDNGNMSYIRKKKAARKPREFNLFLSIPLSQIAGVEVYTTYNNSGKTPSFKVREVLETKGAK